MEELFAATLGWLGTIGTFTAYLLIWRGWASPNAACYAALNAVGGLLAAAGAFAYGAWPATASNLVWSLIGVHGLISIAARVRREAKLAAIHTPDPAAAPLAPASTQPEATHLEFALPAASTAEPSSPSLDELESAVQLIEPATPLSDEELAIFNAITQPLPIIRIAQPQEQGSLHLTPELQ